MAKTGCFPTIIRHLIHISLDTEINLKVHNGAWIINQGYLISDIQDEALCGANVGSFLCKGMGGEEMYYICLERKLVYLSNPCQLVEYLLY